MKKRVVYKYALGCVNDIASLSIGPSIPVYLNPHSELMGVTVSRQIIWVWVSTDQFGGVTERREFKLVSLGQPFDDSGLTFVGPVEHEHYPCLVYEVNTKGSFVTNLDGGSE